MTDENSENGPSAPAPTLKPSLLRRFKVPGIVGALIVAAFAVVLAFWLNVSAECDDQVKIDDLFPKVAVVNEDTPIRPTISHCAEKDVQVWLKPLFGKIYPDIPVDPERGAWLIYKISDSDFELNGLATQDQIIIITWYTGVPDNKRQRDFPINLVRENR